MLAWEEEHLALLNLYIPELALVNDAQEHVAFVLVEPFLRPSVVCERMHTPKYLSEGVPPSHCNDNHSAHSGPQQP